MRITLEAAKKRYGEIESGIWPDEAVWCSFATIPQGVEINNSMTGAAMTRVYCNRDMITPLEQALANVVSRGLASELRTFDGCLMVRDVRGKPGQLSAHAYALAIDLNAKSNPLGGPVEFSKELVKCFTDAGFDWGGDFKRVDAMHFSFCWEGKDLSENPQ